MTGFIHTGETDDKTAGPDFISAVKLMVRENKNNGEEKHSQSDADVQTERNMKKISQEALRSGGGRRCLLGAACRGQQRPTRNPWEGSFNARRGIECAEMAGKAMIWGVCSLVNQ